MIRGIRKCRTWLGLGASATETRHPASGNHDRFLGDDQESPPYHNPAVTNRVVADITLITSAVRIAAIAVPSASKSKATADVAAAISTMAHAIADTPRARDLYHADHDRNGLCKDLVSTTGTAKAILAAIDQYFDTAIALLARGEHPWGQFWTVGGKPMLEALLSSVVGAMRAPGASADIIAEHYAELCLDIERIIKLLKPVSSVRSVLSAITGALASVANTVATSPEESMHAIASAYASYASRIADDIASGALSALMLEGTSFSVVSPTTSRSQISIAAPTDPSASTVSPSNRV